MHRPTWSVMIPTYNCAAMLRETLDSVLSQDPGPDRMQIEVVDDASTRDDPEAVVRELGRGRVAFHRHPENVGATSNFNACLSRSRGHLVHILHGDDLVLPGFYGRMQDLFGRHPGAGSAVCRHMNIEEDGLWAGPVPPRQRIPGIYPDALATLASQNWTQFAAVVLNRSVVECVGGFHPSLIHAADWDLWKRAALHQPVAYEPSVLACYRVFAGNDTSKLARTGANSADIHHAIDLSARYLQFPESAAWLREAGRFYAEYACGFAQRLLSRGDHEGFRSQIREACRLDPTFYRSPRHLKLRLRSAEQRLSRGLAIARGWVSDATRPSKPAPSPASTAP
jgi:glycosyltransferase involved in cell wall biosynthesis